MKRIYPPHAYADGRIDSCFWAETVSESVLDRPALTGDATTDVAIIGAGYTGLSAALRLAENGVRVTVVDTRHPGWGASGRNGGFCCLGGSKLDPFHVGKLFGENARRAHVDAERASVNMVRALLTTHGIDADTHSDGETILAHSPRAMRKLRGHAEEVARDYGITPTLIEPADLPAHGMNGTFHGGLTLPIGFGLNPRKYVAGLLNAAERAGVVVHGNTPVTGINHGANHVLTTPGATLTAYKVVLATNGYSSDDLPPWMDARYMPVQSSVIVTRPLTDAEITTGWSSDQMAYDSRPLLHYFRLMPDRRFLFGMRGGLGSSDRSEARVQGMIRRDFETMFPFWHHIETPHYWSGMVCLASGLMPYVGPVPNLPGVFASFAYHGNGVAMGSYLGSALADQVLGHTAEIPDHFQQPPKRFPLGRSRRLLMYAAYGGAWFSSRW